jgi:hypothetical protein
MALLGLGCHASLSGPLLNLYSSQLCSCIYCIEQQKYEHNLPATLNVHHIPFYFGSANAAMGFDVGGGNWNSHRFNVSSLSINLLISTISLAILCRSLFPNPCCGLAAKWVSIWLGNIAY